MYCSGRPRTSSKYVAEQASTLDAEPEQPRRTQSAKPTTQAGQNTNSLGHGIGP
jgi:hypothetical protein